MVELGKLATANYNEILKRCPTTNTEKLLLGNPVKYTHAQGRFGEYSSWI